MDSVDCIVIGAGVVGIAIARNVAQQGGEVLVLEKESVVASHCSSRNSEVIHAGIYYPTGSLKARLCVSGKALLYDYCRDRGITHDMIGKLIVATANEQIPALGRLHEQARSNGVKDLQALDARTAKELEPQVNSVAALLSPSTGIIDSHAYILSLQGDLENAGGAIALNTEVTGIARAGEEFVVETSDGYSLASRHLVNSAGLWAPDVARLIDRSPSASLPKARFAKGHYFTYSGKAPFQRLVYPMPNNASLGTHATLDTGGGVRFGPDLCWIDDIDYSFDETRREAFRDSVAAFFPGVELDRLQPGYTGIRPKIVGPSEPSSDFRIQGAAEHGVPGLINLLGLESPALTASLAIAEYVSERLRQEI